MRHRQLSIFLENKPSVLAEVFRALSSQSINIRGISISDTVDYCVARVVVDDPLKAVHVLGERGALVDEHDILSVTLPNRPNALVELGQRLAEAEINIDYAYGSTNGEKGTLFLRVSDIDRAEALIGD